MFKEVRGKTSYNVWLEMESNWILRNDTEKRLGLAWGKDMNDVVNRVVEKCPSLKKFIDDIDMDFYGFCKTIKGVELT